MPMSSTTQSLLFIILENILFEMLYGKFPIILNFSPNVFFKLSDRKFSFLIFSFR